MRVPLNCRILRREVSQGAASHRGGPADESRRGYHPVPLAGGPGQLLGGAGHRAPQPWLEHFSPRREAAGGRFAKVPVERCDAAMHCPGDPCVLVEMMPGLLYTWQVCLYAGADEDGVHLAPIEVSFERRCLPFCLVENLAGDRVAHHVASGAAGDYWPGWRGIFLHAADIILERISDGFVPADQRGDTSQCVTVLTPGVLKCRVDFCEEVASAGLRIRENCCSASRKSPVIVGRVWHDVTVLVDRRHVHRRRYSIGQAGNANLENPGWLGRSPCRLCDT